MTDILVLPLRPSIGSYRFDTDIDGATYVFDVEWNSRDNIDRATGKPMGAWYFHVYEQNLTRIACSIKIVLGTYLGRRVNHRLFRRGVFTAVDTTNSGRDAGFDDLGTRVIVKWIPTVRVLSILRSLERV